MVERQEVEVILAEVHSMAEINQVAVGDIAHPVSGDTLAALCRAWLAVDGAQEGVVEEWGRNKGEWYLDIRLTELSDGMHHERVRIVPVEGDQ